MKKPIVILCALLFSASRVHAQTLTTSFVDVAVMDVPLGSPRLVEDDQGKGIVLRNQGKDAIPVRVMASIPTAEELVPGFEPIPDISWVQLTPNSVVINPHDEATCQIVLNIPNQRKFRNKMYQVTIWSESQPAQKGQVQVLAALKSRLRFKTLR